jgi:hypothetical protein
VSDALAPFKAEFNITPVKPEQIARIAWSAMNLSNGPYQKERVNVV